MARVDEAEFTELTDAQIASSGIGTSPRGVSAYKDLQDAVYRLQPQDTADAMLAAADAVTAAAVAQTAADAAQAAANAAVAAAAGALQKAANLSDLASVVTARGNLGLGALAVKSTVNDGDWSGLDLSISNGGTGASSASVARGNLGVVIGSDVQAWDADLDSISALSATGILAYRSGAGIWSPVTIGSGISFAAGTLSATGSGGTVTSVTGTAPIVSSGGTTPAISITPATTGAAGSMSASDKAKLDGIASGAQTGTVTTVSVTAANGVTGSVANPTTTPAITLTLGAITPSSVSSSGIIQRDSQYYMDLSGAVPIFQFDSADYWSYDRSTNTRTFFIGSVARETLTAAGVVYSGTVAASNFSGSSSGANTGDQTITLTGDVTGSGTGSFTATIANQAVTNGKLANVATATFKGRTTAGSGSPEDLNSTQATALLNSFTSALKGLVPASGGGTANFLRADGAFAIPPGTGVTSVSGTAPIVSSGGTTPAISINAATTSLAGSMSATDKARIDGLSGGTSFPGTPASGDRYFRTDRQIAYTYDGTRWLSDQLFVMDMRPTDALLPITASTTMRTAVPFYNLYSTYITDYVVSRYLQAVGTWTYALSRVAGGTVTALGSSGAVTDATGTWLASRITVNAVVPSTAVEFELSATLNSGSANEYVIAQVLYRLIG